MKLPELKGVVERRLLVNYRVDPSAVEKFLPAPFRPQLLAGWAVAGICLIRLGELRPGLLPRWAGLRSENAAHRVAVEWDGPDGSASGVYIPRRDTGAIANVVVGGRLFPGKHHRAKFAVHETPRELHVAFTSLDLTTMVEVQVQVADDLSESALFGSLDDASRFFERGSTGFSDTRDRTRFDGIELSTEAWRVEPADVIGVRSSFFEDPERFPPGSATLDCALLMRGVPVRWKPLPPIEHASGQVVTSS